jgi:hypothetical protein
MAASGPKTPDLKPHQTATLTLGAVAKAMPGACSIPGHKEAGMTFEVRVSGTAPAAAAADHSDTAVDDSAKLDPNATPPAAWQAYDPTLACTPCSPSPPSWPAASPSSCRRAAPRPRSATCGRCSAPSPWVPPCSGWLHQLGAGRRARPGRH